MSALQDALGSAAVKRPSFDFGGVTEDEDAFIKTAVAFEDLGTAAYKGQAYRIDSDALLAAAVSIHSVEARHAAWIRYLAGAPPASSALDEPKSMSEVRQHRRLDRASSCRARARNLRRSRDSLADASPCPRRWSGGARRRRRSSYSHSAIAARM